MTVHDPSIPKIEGEIAPGIVPRDLVFNISAHPKRHWFGGDPMKTAVMDSFSIFLPEGERFFIRSLKHYAKSANDAVLEAEIRGYASQEAFHTREHEDYNLALKTLGYDVARMEAPVRKILRDIEDPMFRLAVTCAIEHLTATFSIATLRSPSLWQDAAPSHRRLWMWHALEELEHAAVALNVFYKATEKRRGWQQYLIRVGAMNAVILPFVGILVRNISAMAKSDGIARGPRFWGQLLRVLFADPGYFRLGFTSFIRYYSPWFDPAKSIDPNLIEKGRALLKADMGERST